MNKMREAQSIGPHQALTETIIGCAFTVHNKLGFGFLESVYEKCLAIELRKAALQVELQRPLVVHYSGEEVGHFVADMIINDVVLVELKSVRALIEAHEVQLVNYLTATGIEIGLLLNFGEARVEVRRKLRTLPSRASCSSRPPS
jgi:GxxExxY protein